MAKYSKEMVKACADWVAENGLIDYGGARLVDFLKAFNIDDMTYYNWLKKSEFSDAINTAKQTYLSQMKRDAVNSLRRLILGYDKQKRRTEFKETPSGQPKISKQTTEDVHYPPNIKAIIFCLTNLDPDNWKLRATNEEKKEIQVKADDTSLLDTIPDDVLVEVTQQLQIAMRNKEQRKLVEDADEATIIEELAEAVN